MDEIPIISKAPVIFTKDSAFLESSVDITMEPGLIILLPEDAVLYVPNEEIIVEDKNAK
jgi:hypothetical protein